MNMALSAYITYLRKSIAPSTSLSKKSLQLFFKTPRNMMSIFRLFSSMLQDFLAVVYILAVLTH